MTNSLTVYNLSLILHDCTASDAQAPPLRPCCICCVLHILLDLLSRPQTTLAPYDNENGMQIVVILG